MLIFLDIDGVMTPAKSWKPAELLDDGFPAFSDRAVNALQKIITEDTTIMLTTSHKSNYSIGQWKSIFKKRGIDGVKIIRLNYNFDNVSRKDEIERWFNVNETEDDFIILDDDSSLNELPAYLKNNLILTSPHIGFTEKYLQEIRKKPTVITS